MNSYLLDSDCDVLRYMQEDVPLRPFLTSLDGADRALRDLQGEVGLRQTEILAKHNDGFLM